jgi:hypothetical protein
LKGQRPIRSRWAGAAAAALAICIAIPAAAAQNTAIWIEPAETRVAPGELCTLYVHVDDQVDSLSCADCFVGFDTAVVSLVAAEEGQLYEEALFPTFFAPELPSPDTIGLVDCVLGYRSYIIAPGSLFRIIFEALEVGVTDAGIGSARIWDIDRIQLEEQIGQSGRIIVTTQTGEAPSTPGGAQLSSYPNPFNPATTIVLDLPRKEKGESRVDILIIDAAGRKVRNLFSGTIHALRSEFHWDGTSDAGSAVSSGLYFAVSRTESMRLQRKLVLIR